MKSNGRLLASRAAVLSLAAASPAAADKSGSPISVGAQVADCAMVAKGSDAQSRNGCGAAPTARPELRRCSDFADGVCGRAPANGPVRTEDAGASEPFDQWYF